MSAGEQRKAAERSASILADRERVAANRCLGGHRCRSHDRRRDLWPREAN